MHLSVRDTIGRNAITLRDGQAIFEIVSPRLTNGETVYLDFDGVEVFASPFFNAAIGQLLGILSPTALNSLLRMTNLSDLGTRTVRSVIENAKEYFSRDSKQRAALDSILENATVH